jgi:hypothetical protein
MQAKLYKHYRKPSYFKLRRVGYGSITLAILMVSIVVPLSLLTSVDAEQSSIITSSSIVSEVTSESSIEEEMPPYAETYEIPENIEMTRR